MPTQMRGNGLQPGRKTGDSLKAALRYQDKLRRNIQHPHPVLERMQRAYLHLIRALCRRTQ